MERIKKQVNIHKIFVQYILAFSVGTIALIIFVISLFQIGVSIGEIRPANYYEKQIELQRKSIESAEKIDNLMLKQYKYVVYDFSGKIIQGNIDKKHAGQIWDDMQKGIRSSGSYYYTDIKRKKDICVVLYTINTSYKNLFLQKYLPNPEVCLIGLFILLFILEVLLLSRYFGKSLTKEMLILKNVTDKIQSEDLDFKVEQSKIIEINDILNSLVKMKEELKDSLSKQWEMESTRREQVAALAHDIKTPLTILRGNAELLSELNLNLEQDGYNQHILKSVDEMEVYIKTLLDITKSEEGTSLKFSKVEAKRFINDIIEGISICALDKNLNIIKEIKNIPEFIYADEDALKRAIMNVMINAIEYSPENNDLIFSVDIVNSKVVFAVEDSGRGFTKEEIVSATDQFYKGDKSRSSKNHYGMGLYIAKSFVKQHNGNIRLSNSERLCGAKVVIEIPM